MKISIKLAFAAIVVSAAACTTGDKKTPADTATAAATKLDSAAVSLPAPATATDPDTVMTGASAPVSKPAPAKTVAKPAPKTTVRSSDTVPLLRDSAIRPRGVIDDKGNVRPIKRDSLR